jgi:hypothetical protein
MGRLGLGADELRIEQRGQRHRADPLRRAAEEGPAVDRKSRWIEAHSHRFTTS